METQDHVKRRRSMAYLGVIGGFFVQITLGGIYTYGNMAPYMQLYMKNYTSYSNYTTVKNFWLWIFDLTVFGFGSSMSLGGFIEKKTNAFFTVLLGGWIMSLSILVCYWAIKVHLILVAVTHGLLSGIGAGIAYSVSMAVPIEWFPQSKGLITGILVSGYALGPFFFDFMQAYYINQDIINVKLPEAYKVPLSFVIIGVTYAFIQLIGAYFIRRRKPITEEDSSQIILLTMFRPINEVNLKPHQIIFQRDFWILWITYSFNSSVSIMVLTLHKMFGNMLHFSNLRIILVSEVAALCNGMGTILWGCLIDKIGYKVLMTILTIMMSVMIGTFYFCCRIENINENSRYVIYFIWVAIMHLILSGNYSVFPTMCVKLYGIQNFAGNYGVLFSAFSFGSIVTSLLTFGLLETNAKPQDFVIPFMVGCGLSGLSCILTRFYLGGLHFRNSVDDGIFSFHF